MDANDTAAIMYRLRTQVFKMTQQELASVAGTSVSKVCRFESGQSVPDLWELSRLRDYAKANKLRWRDAALFEPSEKGPSDGKRHRSGKARKQRHARKAH